GFWLPLGAGALVGGTFRALKRGKDIKYDQAMQLRHQTLGGKASEVLGKDGELGYGDAVMEFKKAQKDVDDLLTKFRGGTKLSDSEMNDLAKIYARLELERDMLHDKKLPQADLFKLDEADGKDYGSTTAAKSALRVALAELGFSEKNLQNT